MIANQRQFTRVTVAIEAELRGGRNVIIHGKLAIVSFKGLLVRRDADGCFGI